MFRAAFYETEVTPPLGTYMPGCVAIRYAENVLDKIYAKAVVIDNGENVVATVVLDAVNFPQETHDIVVKRVGEYTGIKPENITVAANHTHTGAPTKGNSGANIPDEKEYLDIVMKLMADCITLAYKRLQPVTIKYGRGEVYGVSFNRNFVMRDGTISTNSGRDKEEVVEYSVPPEVPVVKIQDAQNNPDAKILNPNCVGNLAGIDPGLPILAFENEEGKLIGAMINFACHQTSLSDVEISGDYSSVISKELKKLYGEDFVSLFIIGPSGDVNHIDPSDPTYPWPADACVRMGKKLAEEAVRVIEKAEPIKGNALISKKETLVFNKRGGAEKWLKKEVMLFAEGKKKHYKHIEMVISYLNANTEPTGFLVKVPEKTMDIIVQCTRIGDVYYYALPGEMYVDFGLTIKSKSPSDKVLITELANNGGGYVPIREVFLPQSIMYEQVCREGICLEPEAGYIITDKVLEFAKEMAD